MSSGSKGSCEEGPAAGIDSSSIQRGEATRDEFAEVESEWDNSGESVSLDVALKYESPLEDRLGFAAASEKGSVFCMTKARSLRDRERLADLPKAIGAGLEDEDEDEASSDLTEMGVGRWRLRRSALPGQQHGSRGVPCILEAREHVAQTGCSPEHLTLRARHEEHASPT